MKKLQILTIATTTLVSTGAWSQNFLPDLSAKDYYVAPLGLGATIDEYVPRYVRQLDKTEFEVFKNIDWIDAGLQYRARFEDRENDLRRAPDNSDHYMLSRTRAYFAIKNIADPFRFTLELQDSRIFSSKYPATNRDLNKVDFLQSYVELHFKNALGNERPVSVRAGRMTIDVLDRKLFGRNEWRNTTNSFQGVRTILGQRKNDWQIDAFAVQPLNVSLTEADSRNKNIHLYGITSYWRRWSDIVTLEPFYLKYNRNASNVTTNRNVNTTGLRGYGIIDESGFDYDFIGIYQFGNSNNQTQRSIAGAAEVGYSFDYQWEPRLSLRYGYADGDHDPYDNNDESFESFFPSNSQWSFSDYIQFRNINIVRPRIILKPTKKLQVDSGYSFFSLASGKDSWSVTGLRDKTGSSGTSLGQEFDIRTRYQLTPNIATEIGYSHFEAGEFIRKLQKNDSSDFVYLQLTWNLFK